MSASKKAASQGFGQAMGKKRPSLDPGRSSVNKMGEVSTSGRLTQAQLPSQKMPKK
jgi:hypothetical protein